MNRQNFTARMRAHATTVRQPRAEVPGADVTDGVATIRLYDPIDSWGDYYGVSAKELVHALDELPAGVTEIRLHINSPGGDVFDGIAILNALRNHDARIVAVVDGIAASAASFIACGADEVVMARNSELMIHDAWGLCVGNEAEMLEMAKMLGHLSDNIASVYAEKSGGDIATWRAAMERETWYSAEEAVEAGLADRVDDAKKADGAKSRFDLSIFTYAGRAAAPAPDVEPAPPAPDAKNAADPGTPPAVDDETQTTPVRVDEFRHLVATTRI